MMIINDEEESESSDQHKQIDDITEPIMVHSTSSSNIFSLNCLLEEEKFIINNCKEDEDQDEAVNGNDVHEDDNLEEISPTITDMEQVDKNSTRSSCWPSFTHSQFYVHLLMSCTLLTFGGFCVLAPNPIRTMRPTIFAFTRSLLMVVCYLFLSLIVDREYSFRSERFLLRIKNPFLRFMYKKTPCFKDFKRMVLCGSMFMVNTVLFVIGIKMVGATIAAIVQPLVAAEVCLISIFLGREPSSIIKILGAIIATIGAMAMLIIPSFTKEKEVVVEGTQESMLEAFSFALGMLILIINTLANAFYMILLKKLLNKKIPGITLNFWTFLGGLYIPFLAALYSLKDFEIRRLDNMSYIGMAYAVLIHGTLSFILNSKASSLTSPTVIAIYSTVSPIVSTVMTVAISGDEVSLWIIPGSIGIFLGVVLVIFAKWRDSKIAQDETTTIIEKKMNEINETNEDLEELDVELNVYEAETQENDK